MQTVKRVPTTVGLLVLILLMSIASQTFALDREDCGSFIGTYEVAGSNRPNITTEQIRVYPLLIGTTRVSYEQFYGGLELSGFFGMQRLFNSESFFFAPIYMYLIEHPVVGPFVVDTGINPEMSDNYNEYFSGGAGTISRMMGEEYRLEPEQSVPQQLARFGYTEQDIELVILTHAHDDHIGGLPYFQDARIVLADPEMLYVNVVTSAPMPVNTRYYEGVSCWEEVKFTDGAVGSFETSQDLLGDGTVILVPTPGHTEGSQAVLVRTEDYNLVLTGDTVYTMRHLDPDHIMAFIPDTDKELTAQSARRLASLPDELENTYIVPSHDHTGYLETVMPSLMNCGILGEHDRQNVALYNEALFDEEGHVREAMMPAYIATNDGSNNGTISAPEIELVVAESSTSCEVEV